MRRIIFNLIVLAAFDVAWGELPTILATPDKTLMQIRDEVRALRVRAKGRGATEHSGVRVVLGEGRYEVGSALSLDGRDSDVIWQAAPGAEVRISGGRLIDAAPEPVTDAGLLKRLPEKARGKVVQYDLAKLGVSDWGDCLYNHEDAVQRRVAGTWNQGEFIQGSHPPPKGDASAGRMELFVDDRPLSVARTPRDVVYHTDRLLGPVDARHTPTRSFPVSAVGWFTCREDLPAAWAAEPDPHVCGCWCRDWAEQHQRVVYLDCAKKEMRLSEPYHQYTYRSGAEFFAFNLLCELDEPGEWYVDRATAKLLVWMPDAAPSHRVELSMAGRLVELAGATNVVFRGVTFEACRNSAVKMAGCEGCVLESCTVRNVGHHALIAEDGHGCGVRDSKLYGLGGGGAFLVDDNRLTLESSGHFAERNDIHDYGRWNRMYRPAVCLAGVGMRAVGNRIHDAPHAGILFFGCDLLMQSNEICRVCRESKDCGAIYSGRSWMLRGNRILDNSFHDIIGLRGAYTRTIYLDDSMADTLIAGNRFERCTWAVFNGGSRENVITNNVFIDCPHAYYTDNRGTGWQRRHIDGRLKEMREKGTLFGVPFRTGPYVERYPAVKVLPAPDPYNPVLNVFAHNVFARGDGRWLKTYGNRGVSDSPDWWHDGLSIEEVSELGQFHDNVVDGKPLDMGNWFTGAAGVAFADPANWSAGRVPAGSEPAVVPRGRTVVVRAADLPALKAVTTLELRGTDSVLELRDVSVDFPADGIRLTGLGQVRAVATTEKPLRVDLRAGMADFAGSFFFTNVAAYAHGPRALGRSCPVTFCKTTPGVDCMLHLAGGGISTSDIVFLPPRGMMWYALAGEPDAARQGPIVNRGRIGIPRMSGKFCGRILAKTSWRQEGRLDLGSRIDVCGDVVLDCPVRFTGRDEALFTDDAAGVLRFGPRFTLGPDLDRAASLERLRGSPMLGPHKSLRCVD